MLAMLGLFTQSVGAQDYEIPVKNSVVTNSFWSNWYLSVGGDFNSAYTSEEDLGNKNPFSVDRGTFGFDVAFGKWFTPNIGLRTKFEGIWSKQVISADHHHAYKYWDLHQDVTFNLSNMLRGYNEYRVWNFIPYIGLGVARNMSASRYDVSYHLGLLNNFRISTHWTAFVDFHAKAMEGGFDNAPIDAWASHKTFSSRHFDKMLGISVGVTYHIGKSNWTKTPDIEALLEMNREQLDAMNSSLQDQEVENDRLRQLLSEKKPEGQQQNVHELVSTSQSVFFNIGSAQVANRRDLVDLKDMVEFAKLYEKNLLVIGYADSKTGTHEYNQRLSEKRANAVADVLVKMGVKRENITVEAAGGVDDIAPFSYNRRVIVKVK